LERQGECYRYLEDIRKTRIIVRRKAETRILHSTFVKDWMFSGNSDAGKTRLQGRSIS
jgi:hypothetical protein